MQWPRNELIVGDPWPRLLHGVPLPPFGTFADDPELNWQGRPKEDSPRMEGTSSPAVRIDPDDLEMAVRTVLINGQVASWFRPLTQ